MVLQYKTSDMIHNWKENIEVDSPKILFMLLYVGGGGVGRGGKVKSDRIDPELIHLERTRFHYTPFDIIWLGIQVFSFAQNKYVVFFSF